MRHARRIGLFVLPAAILSAVLFGYDPLTMILVTIILTLTAAGAYYTGYAAGHKMTTLEKNVLEHNPTANP